MISCTIFDRYEGRDAHLYTLENEFVKVGVLDFGGIINFIKLKTPKGEKNIILGYNSISGYLKSKAYCGATVGRVANRIEKGRFALSGKTYNLSRNDGENCLHGGDIGFDRKFYTVNIEGDSLILSLESPSGDMGFPANLKFEVKFTLEGRKLSVKYCGESDEDTLFSPTCHIYFSLDKEVNDTLLKLNADGFTPADGRLIPTGEVRAVKGTGYDFTEFKSIGEGLSQLNGGIFDTNFVLNGNFVGEAKSADGGISVKVNADMPGVQFYVGDCKSDNENEGGRGFCLEPQYFPNAVNIAGFKTPLLPARKKTTYSITYEFDF